MISKQVLRKQIRETLQTVDSKGSQSLQVSKNLIKLFANPELENISNLGIYTPLEDEVDCDYFCKFFLSKVGEKKTEVLLPRWIDSDFDKGVMEYFRFRGPKDLEIEKFLGKEFKQVRKTQKIKPEALIIPGVAFTREGQRLGRGKGFYDRYLEGFEGIKVGVCFKEQVFNEIPFDEHDQTLDYLVTADELNVCQKEN